MNDESQDEWAGASVSGGLNELMNGKYHLSSAGALEAFTALLGGWIEHDGRMGDNNRRLLLPPVKRRWSSQEA